MQRAASIPPYDPETLPELIGAWVRYPCKSRPRKGWWGEITHVRFVSTVSAAVYIVPNTKRAGNAKWHDLHTVTFRNQSYEPLVTAALKAGAMLKRQNQKFFEEQFAAGIEVDWRPRVQAALEL